MASAYRCVVSLGIRCFTEIYLKKLNMKKFSMPLDGVYLSTTGDIIYLLKNGIKPDDLEHTEDSDSYDGYNKRWGFRSVHTKLENTLLKMNDSHETRYHLATFPHHNLKDPEKMSHFERCYERLSILEREKIKTLFCLFLHPHYPNYVAINSDDIETLCDYLNSKYNYHLLAIYFWNTCDQEPYCSILKQNELYTIYKINNNSHAFDQHSKALKEIFKEFNVQEGALLTYDDMNLLMVENR